MDYPESDRGIRAGIYNNLKLRFKIRQTPNLSLFQPLSISFQR